MEIINQIGISSLGLASVFCIGVLKNPKYGCIFGLLAEPFWFMTAIHHKQWGVLILAIAYAISWSFGVYNYWIKK